MNWTTIAYDINIHSICPIASGVYKFHSDNQILYIGMAKSIQSRIKSHNSFLKNISLTEPKLYISYLETDNYKKIEKELIKQSNPKYNSINNYSKVKSYDNVIMQIKAAMDGRTQRWLSFETRIAEIDLSKKMNGMISFSKKELENIEERLNFKFNS